MNLFEELEEQRREAYVRAVLRASVTDDVVGVIRLFDGAAGDPERMKFC